MKNYLYTGILFAKKETYKIQAAYGSKNSLIVNFLENKPVKSHSIFDRLTLEIDGENFELGECMFKYNPAIPYFSGSLIFIKDVYNFFDILSLKRTANLETYFQSLPLAMGRQQKIKESFREYTSRLTYDLRVYRKYFDELDEIYRDESSEVYKIVQKTILETEGRKFFSFFDKKLEDLKKETENFTPEEYEYHAYFFRRQVWDLISDSIFLKRTNTKPRGYAGDSEMMAMVYRNSYEGDTIFSMLMHKHPIETASAQAVRNRKKMISVITERARNSFQNLNSGFEILSVACGPANELENIFFSPAKCDDYKITLLDQDTEALSEAASNISAIENRYDKKINFQLINESVRTMLRIKDPAREWGSFHFIYSMGLFDYLTTRVAQAVLEKLYTLLKPGGWMIIGNYHEKNPTKNYMDYWGDWVLFYRSEEEFKQIASNISANSKSVVFEETGCQMFLIIEKPV